MTAKRQAFLLKTGNSDTPLSYTTVAGLRVNQMTVEKEAVSITATGIFTGSAGEVSIRNRALAGVIDDYELSFESDERMQGKFLVTRLDYAGDYNGERSYTISLESVEGVTVS